MAHCDKNLVEKNQADPFTMADLKKEYAAKLEKALGDVDFSKVFRIESQSEMLQYDMDKQIFPLKGLWCPQIKTDQPDALAKIGFPFCCNARTCCVHCLLDLVFIAVNANGAKLCCGDLII